MRTGRTWVTAALYALAGLAGGMAGGMAPAWASGGILTNAIGPGGRMMGGISTPVALDGYGAANNPGTLTALDGERLELGLEVFMPRLRVRRTGADAFGGIYNIDSTSRGSLIFVPEGAYVRPINDDWSWSLAVSSNGGIATDLNDDNGVPGSNLNPEECGNRPSNFLFGCGPVGMSLLLLNIAPALGWQVSERHHVGISPQFVYQHVKIFGLQALQGVSQEPDRVTNNSYDSAWGAGVRIGWYGEITDWLTLGAHYASRVYMQELDKYRGVIANGSLDLPENFTVGAAVRPHPQWLIATEVQRVNYEAIPATANGVLNSLVDPVGQPLGSSEGSGFNWRNGTYYKIGVAWQPTPDLALRAGMLWGKRVMRRGINQLTLNMLVPNPEHMVTFGGSWRMDARNTLHAGYRQFLVKGYRGPSASAVLGIGGTEELRPYVRAVFFAWTREM